MAQKNGINNDFFFENEKKNVYERTNKSRSVHIPREPKPGTFKRIYLFSGKYFI